MAAQTVYNRAVILEALQLYQSIKQKKLERVLAQLENVQHDIDRAQKGIDEVNGRWVRQPVIELDNSNL